MSEERNRRGTGKTTEQIKSAPTGSTFVWCSDNTNYPKKLANDLGRTDLIIVGRCVLESDYFRGRRIPGLVVDHAMVLSEQQARGLSMAFCCVDSGIMGDIKCTE